MKEQPAIWALLKTFTSLCGALRHENALALGAFLGGLVEKFSSERAKKARGRCSRVLGVDEIEAGRIVSGAYRHFGRSLAEFVRLPRMAGCIEEVVSLDGEEHLIDALNRGRGVIFLSAHIGNWEYGAALLAHRGFQVNVIGAEQRDRRITEAIAQLRRSAGVKPIGKGWDLKGALSCLRAAEILAVLLDQDARESGVVSPFLGIPASTPTGPIKLAKKFGCPVVPAHVVRNGDGVRLSLTIEPALKGREGADFGADVQYAVDKCNEVISSWIRKNPDQWLWMYPRWATTLGDI
jgi:KDO2-lipid IV(A) lauroyltransferase